MKNKTKILAVLFTMFISNSTYSQVIVTNPFSGIFTWGTNGNVTNFPYNGSIIPDVSVSSFTKVNTVSSSSSGNFRASSWSTLFQTLMEVGLIILLVLLIILALKILRLDF